jgi:hypothetical protein
VSSTGVRTDKAMAAKRLERVDMTLGIISRGQILYFNIPDFINVEIQDLTPTLPPIRPSVATPCQV